ncbi:phage tail protein [Erythrobacter ani]|uniref:Phage tail protein n=1 Tax=Erythrobacter ani TaxID=2827235 RepID=A0ABS6SMM7_9SPHN|nr:phage tail protein [Erythrobacter ani]MBV7266247.1 phage tail protein [Erythrobacter ani]
MARHDPVLGHNFSVALLESKGADGAGTGTIGISTAGSRSYAGFSEVTGLEMTMAVEDYEAGGINDAVLKFPGRMRWNNLILKRGVVGRRDQIDDSDLWTWCNDYLEGRGVRKDGLITLHDAAGDPVHVWSFLNGLPAKWVGPSLNAGRGEVAVETLEIAHEGIRREDSGAALGRAVAGVFDAIF